MIKQITIVIALFFLSFPTYAVENNEILAPYSISISGGVSLGNYEAGMNWAIVNMLRKYRELCFSETPSKICDALNRQLGKTAGRNVIPELITVTGASAGAINTLATALDWCKRDHSLPDNNIFRDVWVGIDIAKLLPSDLDLYDKDAGGAGGLPDTDGLFSRQNAFGPAFKRLKDEFNATDFRPNCQLNIAVTLTRTTAAKLEVIEGMVVDNSRFVVPLHFETCRSAEKNSQCGAKVTPNLDIADYGLLGNIIYPQLTQNKVVDFDDLGRIIIASAAFPVAFGRVQLDYCIADSQSSDTKLESKALGNRHCPQGFSKETAYFVDGGLFDNVPLGAARILTEQGEIEKHSTAAMTEYRYIYMDPDNHRGSRLAKMSTPDETDKDGHEEISFNDYLTYRYGECFTLICQLAFAQDALKSARQYELYTELRSGYWGEGTNKNSKNLNKRSPTECHFSRRGCRQRELISTNRFPHLTGGFIGYFGAFLNYEFRVYDYYAGIYDASVNISKHFCTASAKSDLDDCVARLSWGIANWLLSSETGGDGQWLFNMLHKLEFGPPSGYEIVSAKSEFSEVNNSMRSVAVAIELVYRRGGTFKGFLDLLRDGDEKSGFESRFAVPKDDGIFADIWNDRYSEWWIPIAKNALPRLQSLEERGDASALALINAAGLGLETLFPEKTKKGFSINQSTNEIVWFDFIPYQIEANVDGSGWGVSWEPTLRFQKDSRFHVDFKFMPWNYSKAGDERIDFAEFTPYLSYNFGETNLHAFGLGPSVTKTYDKWDGFERKTYGVSVYYEFARKVRLTVGKRDMDNNFVGDNTYINLGFTDLPGWAYWLSR